MTQRRLAKSFWKRPEGIAGGIFLGATVLGLGYALAVLIPMFIGSVLGIAGMLMALGLVLFFAFDSKSRNLIGYMFKSMMRSITSLFVQIDPIGILKNYIEELEENVNKMNRQIGQLRGQMHKLKEQIVINQRSIKSNLELASKAKENNKQKVMILKSRKAGRMKESNVRLEELYNKMEIIYRVLSKMSDNSEILKEDIKDQVLVKEQERKAIRASHGAMNAAMSIIKGNPNQRVVFDQAMEAIADDVANKVGEMERFMKVSTNFMESVDVKNGVFEEEGLKMLEVWEKETESLLLGDMKKDIIAEANSDDSVLDLDEPIERPEMEVLKDKKDRPNQYDSFF